MGGKKKQTVAYKYFAGVHMVLGLGPFDSISRIKYGQKTAWEGNATGGQITIDAPYLHGGDDGEGGISGPVDVLMGLPDQARNGYLLDHLGPLCSAFRGVVSLVFKEVYWGNSPYFKTVAVRATRIHKTEDGAPQWYDAKAQIGIDMNPAHIIREAITSTNGGMGRPPGAIDDANFRAVADVLHAEAFGLSYFWSGESSAEEFNQGVLDTIDAKLYVHPRTKLYTIKLIRDDYDIAGLPVLGPAQIRRVEGYKRPTPEELPNSVAVTYWDDAAESNATVQSDDTAAVIAAGAIRSLSRDYSDGVTSGDLAARIAQRDRVSATSPVLSATLFCNRAAANLLPGDAFVFEWPDLHPEPIVMRVVTLKFGGIVRQEVVIEAVEDVFSLDDSAVNAVVPPEWVDPTEQPLPAAVPLAFEAPYYEVLQRYGATRVAEFLSSTPDAGLLLGTAAREPGAINAMVFSDDQIWPTYADLSPTGLLETEAGYLDAALDIAWSSTPLVGTHVQVGAELMRFEGLDVNGWSLVGRAVLDTVPTMHSVSSVAWAWDEAAVTEDVERASGETIDVDMRLRNNSTVGPTTSAGTVTLAARAIRPYPPGLLRINALPYPLEVQDPITVTWAHRNRVTQADQLIDTNVGSITPEAGTTYTASLYNAGTNALIQSTTAISGTSWTANALAQTTMVRLELWAVRDGFASTQKHSVTFLSVVGGGLRITETGDDRITESGDARVLE